MGIRASTLKQAGKGTNRSNAYKGRVIGGADGEKTWPDRWVCNHLHDNRDNDSNTEVSARTCAEWALHKTRAVGVEDFNRYLMYTANPQGLHLLEDATEEQLAWLAERAKAIRTGAAGNAGNRRAYPEEWVVLEDGRRFRGKLWEGEDRHGEHHRRLFVAGPFGSTTYLDGFVDLVTNEVTLKNKPTAGTLISADWLEAARQLQWSIPEWAPQSESAKKEFDGTLRRAQSDEETVQVPAAYRVRINRETTPRSYDVVEVQTDDVHTTGLTRVQAYRLVEELNEERKQVERKLKKPGEVWADQFLYTGELWGKDIRCGHCKTDLVMESEVWFADYLEGGGLTYCSQSCGRKSLEQLNKEVVEDSFKTHPYKESNA